VSLSSLTPDCKLMIASFVLQYCEFKEQKVRLVVHSSGTALIMQDYVSWLKDVKGFVDA